MTIENWLLAVNLLQNSHDTFTICCRFLHVNRINVNSVRGCLLKINSCYCRVNVCTRPRVIPWPSNTDRRLLKFLIVLLLWMMVIKVVSFILLSICRFYIFKTGLYVLPINFKWVHSPGRLPLFWNKCGAWWFQTFSHHALASRVQISFIIMMMICLVLYVS